MTSRLPAAGRTEYGDSQRPLLDLYTFVLLACCLGAAGLAFYNARLAGAVGFGLLVLITLHKVVRRS